MQITSAISCSLAGIPNLTGHMPSLAGHIRSCRSHAQYFRLYPILQVMPSLAGHTPSYRSHAQSGHAQSCRSCSHDHACVCRPHPSLTFAPILLEFMDSERQEIQDQLERVILRLLAEDPQLHYYQGLHDVVLTYLLVVGEDIAYAIMKVLVRCHIR